MQGECHIPLQYRQESQKNIVLNGNFGKILNKYMILFSYIKTEFYSKNGFISERILPDERQTRKVSKSNVLFNRPIR